MREKEIEREKERERKSGQCVGLSPSEKRYWTLNIMTQPSVFDSFLVKA